MVVYQQSFPQSMEGVIMIEELVRRFLYYPTVLERHAPLPEYAKDAKEVWMDCDDGNSIHGLYWPANKGRPTILFFHGNAQSVFEWAMIRGDFAAVDCGLLLIDYPGYGKSSGIHTEESLYSGGKGAYDWLIDKAEVPSDKIIVFGKSLGGGVASKVAKSAKILGLILESTFRSIPLVAQNLLPFVPSDAVFNSERYDTASRIGEINAPVLIIHGTLDELIPVEEGKILFEKAKGPKKLILIENAGHNDVSFIAGTKYGEDIRQWLDNL